MTNSAQPQSPVTVTPYIVPEQMFALIDSVLPFEVCLYHQVLPLSVRDNTLYLGSVHPDESEGLKYVQALLAHTSYTIALKAISATTQQHYLSAFLSYDRQIKEAGEDLIGKSAEMALADDSTYAEYLDDSETSTIPDGRYATAQLHQGGGDDGQGEGEDEDEGETTLGLGETVVAPPEATSGGTQPGMAAGSDPAVDSTARAIAQPQESESETEEDEALEATLNFDLEAIAQDADSDTDNDRTLDDTVLVGPMESLDSATSSQVSIAMEMESTNMGTDDMEDESRQTTTGGEDPSSFAQEFEAALAAEDTSGVIRSSLPLSPPFATAQPKGGTDHSVTIPPAKPSPPVLVLDQVAEALSPEVWDTLPPRALTQALLQRSIVQGIGRLFLERHATHGRILCSQDGVLEAVLDPIPLPNFQGVINELKMMADVPLLQVERAKQVDLERIYQDELILLRLRLTPGTEGEEATLQVLRGAALKFYQQQQLGKLGQNALTLARRLQHQVAEIEARSRLLPGVGTDAFPSVPELRQLIRYIATTLDHLYYP